MKTTLLALSAATFIALAAPAFAAPPAATTTPAAANSSSTPAAQSSSSMTAAQQLVSRAQTKLKADSLYTGPINGQRTPATVSAIRSFQTAHHLTVNGRLDASTRRALGI